MGRAEILRGLAGLSIVALLAFSGTSALGAEDDLAALNRQVSQLFREGKYQDAVAIQERAVALAERTLEPDHPDRLGNVNNLAVLYFSLGRYDSVEPLLKRVLTSRERTLGAEHQDTLGIVYNLGTLYYTLARYGEAEIFYRRAMLGRERTLGAEHPATLESVNSLGLLHRERGRYGEAEKLYRRALAGREKVLGPEHTDTLTTVNSLAVLYDAQGQYNAAEPLYRRALAGRERALGPEHPVTLESMSNLGFLYQVQGLDDEAELLWRRVVAGFERALGPEHPTTLSSVSNLGFLYDRQGRLNEAEPLYVRTLAGRERALGPKHPDTLLSVNNLGIFYQKQGNRSAAEPLLKRVLAGREELFGPEHRDTLQSLNSLGHLYKDQARYSEAEPLIQRALAGRERLLGPEHPDTLLSLGDLAGIYLDQARFSQAEPLFQRSLVGRERVLGPEHPDTLGSVNNVALMSLVKGDRSRAVELWRRSTAAIAGRTQRSEQGLSGNKKSEIEQLHWQFVSLVQAAFRLTLDGGKPDMALSREMFQTAQWVLGSEAAQSLAKMAVRTATGKGALAALVRERQDLAAEWQQREVARNAALGRETAKRDAKAEADNSARMTAIDARFAAIDERLAVEFPDYAALTAAVPLPVEEAQAALGADEALVMFLDGDDRFSPILPEETIIWVVTKNDLRWVRSDLGTAALAREVRALRCGLDYTAWKDSGCQDATNVQYAPSRYLAGEAPPFDHGRAHRLYKSLFGEVEDLIKGKHLLLIPSGPLTQLPFQVLVTAPVADGDHRSIEWLVRGHALTVLPAVASLKALRRVSRPSAASKPLIGFGNPLLDGDQADPVHGDDAKKLADLARQKLSCSKTAWERVATLFSARRGANPLQMRRGLADVSLVRLQWPLPETADELCAVARNIDADVTELRLGDRATEREIKTLSATGELAQYRVVHFATHGAMAGEFSENSEAGLILTPPEKATEDDDGYLSASEIAGLRLDADWVILSACNTAAGDASNAKPLSGLARAFIYAQARALLVSHWEVDSKATVKLITAAMREIGRDHTVGRAEALRRAMLSLIGSGSRQEAHPSYWAPFVVVGEGARR